MLVASLTAAALFAGTGTSIASVAGTCSFPALSQPFQSLGDSNSYFLAPGGDFESGTSGWALTGGARLSHPNESYFVGSHSDRQSLELPTAASVTTPSICVTSSSPTFRMFIKGDGVGRREGKRDSQLAVYLNFAGADGQPQQVQIAGLTVRNGAWTLSPVISFIEYISTPLQNGYADVSFTIRSNDSRGKWLIDDLYVDPYVSR